MRSGARSVVLVVIALLLLLPEPGVPAAASERHSGTVVALDPEGGVMILEEVGPWRVERGRTVLTRRTIRLTPETRFNVFIRVSVPGAFAGDFLEVALEATDIATGDFVTAECARQGRQLVALTVTLAETMAEMDPAHPGPPTGS